jgi:integrase/recombinase XerD
MNLQQLIQHYLSWRETLGWRPLASGGHLGALSRFIGEDVDIADVRPKQVAAFLKGAGPITLSWHLKYGVLQSFYRWAIDRSYVGKPPLPKVVPKHPPAFVPYIYSVDELRRILQAFDEICRPGSLLEPVTAKTMMLTLYSCGLRRQEAINLDRTDVDLNDSLLKIRDTKFLKTRLVPFGEQLGRELTAYSRTRSENAEGAFFTTRKDARIDPQMIQRYFRLACVRAGVQRNDSPRFQPRLHDLRHTFAVHRLTSWYEQGADVQRLLSHLSTYLGHVCIRNTQVYLTMTPALLHEACQRFEQYAEGGTR